MKSEYVVLNHLHENEITTQRKISKRTGLSLGAVNLLLKKMARKGLIKIEKLNARTVRYILTPKGMQEKSRLAYCFIRNSYRQILKINEALDRILSEEAEEQETYKIIIFGPADEIAEILKQYFNHTNVAYEVCSDGDLWHRMAADNSRLVLVWRDEEDQALKGRHQTINIMNML